MSANVEAMVREGAAALKAGRKDEARTLLLKAVELDPYNEEGWLWLSGIVDSPEDQRTCLENVLAINPNNQRAQQGLAYLNRSTSTAPAPGPTAATTIEPPPAPPVAPPSPPAPAAPSASVDPFGGLSEFASAFSTSSVTWDDPGIATSSASAFRSVNEPSSDVLDEWVSGLGLSSDNRDTATTGAAVPPAASPFTDISFGIDDEDEPNDIFSTGPFGVDTAFETPPVSPPISAPPPAFITSPSPGASGAAKRMSPGIDDGLSASTDAGPGRSSGSTSSSSLIAEAFPAGFTPMQEADFRDTESNKALSGIPAEIKPTRIPGTDGDRPFLLVAATVLLFVINLGAAFVLMRHLTG